MIGALVNVLIKIADAPNQDPTSTIDSGFVRSSAHFRASDCEFHPCMFTEPVKFGVSGQ
jgi:hypothetical protein